MGLCVNRIEEILIQVERSPLAHNRPVKSIEKVFAIHKQPIEFTIAFSAIVTFAVQAGEVVGKGESENNDEGGEG